MPQTSLNLSRFGFVYRPDTNHYRAIDAHTWLPLLKASQIGWLKLIAPQGRAIAEDFIAPIVDAGIRIVLQYPFDLRQPVQWQELESLLRPMATWGVEAVSLFDTPNERHTWPANAWGQPDLVENFLDRFVPLAQAINGLGLHPVFPALEPGGDYWDTAFLSESLSGISRRLPTSVINQLWIGANAWADGREPAWGMGGPDCWPDALPYHTPEGQQNQIGPNIADWVDSISRSILGKDLPIILLNAGWRGLTQPKPHERAAMLQHWAANLPESVTGCCLHMLTANEDTIHARQAWFNQAALAESQASGRAFRALFLADPSEPKSTKPRPIDHYLLLPYSEPNTQRQQLARLASFIQAHLPTIGYSLTEAAMARRVSIAGDQTAFPPEAISLLESQGVFVQRISPTGMSLAS